MRRPRRACAQGLRQAGTGIADRAGGAGGEPLRGGAARSRPVRRPGAGNGPAHGALAPGPAKRGPCHCHHRRIRHGQVAAGRSAVRAHRRRTAPADRDAMLALSQQHGILSGDAPDRACRPLRDGGFERAKTRQARRVAGRTWNAGRSNRPAARRSALAAGGWPLPAARAHAGAAQDRDRVGAGRTAGASVRARAGACSCSKTRTGSTRRRRTC